MFFNSPHYRRKCRQISECETSMVHIASQFQGHIVRDCLNTNNKCPPDQILSSSEEPARPFQKVENSWSASAPQHCQDTCSEQGTLSPAPAPI